MSITMMGIDPHLDSVTVTVMNSLEQSLCTETIPNTTKGHRRISRLAGSFQVARVGIEGASGYGRSLSEHLTSSGIEVVNIPTRLTARLRPISGNGKTDSGDAETVCRAVLRGEGNQWTHQPSLETLRVLVHHRDSLVRAQTRAKNQLRSYLSQVDPEASSTLKRLRSRKSFQALTSTSYPQDTFTETISMLIRQLAEECVTRHDQINTLKQQIEDNMPPAGHTLQQIPGCSTITAGMILAELAGTTGFTTDAKYASYTGTSPLDASSGRQQRHRLNRSGNRQANRALHIIAKTQARLPSPGRTYITRKISEGKTRKEAIRSLKRHLARTIHKTLKHHKLT